MKNQYPPWVNSAVFYQIYPQSFYDSNDDGIGDLQGIIRKLDYIKSLGVDAVWLNPCFESPFQDAGYDISDYYKVAPRYGTNEDLKELFQKAHAKGLKILLDLVPGHTSIEHPWFKESCKPERNKYTNWFVWTDDIWIWQDPDFKFITGYCDRNGSFITNFFWMQPALNYGFAKPDPKKKWQLPTDHPDVLELRKEIRNIMKFWLDMGADGFRVDMAGSLVKKDKTGEKIASFWKDIRQMLDKDYPDAFIVSEWFNPKLAVGSGFHADFISWDQNRTLISRDGKPGYFNKDSKVDALKLMRSYISDLRAVEGKGHIANFSGNHDSERFAWNRSKEELEIILAFLLTMPGLPFIYYGDEIGMRHVDGLVSKEGGYNRTAARTPMQWDDSENTGFSKAQEGQLYLPVDKGPGRPVVSGQEKDKDSLLNFTRFFTKLRHKNTALQAEAGFKMLYPSKKKHTLAYLREDSEGRFLVALNPSKKPIVLDLSIPKWKGTAESIMAKGAEIRKGKNGNGISMKGVSFGIWKLT